MKLIWLGYLIYSFSNRVMRLCIETAFMAFRPVSVESFIALFPRLPYHMK